LTVLALFAVVAALLAQAVLAWEAQQDASALVEQAVAFSLQFSPARNERVAKAASVIQTISFFITLISTSEDCCGFRYEM
jgi:hypothetical protein